MLHAGQHDVSPRQNLCTRQQFMFRPLIMLRIAYDAQ
jgi:hypothetical protein